MAHHIFQLETELQNIPEAAPKASPRFSVSGKLAGPPIFFLKPAWTYIPLWESASKLFHRFPRSHEAGKKGDPRRWISGTRFGIIKKISQEN
jgi:hypothetical protein